MSTQTTDGAAPDRAQQLDDLLTRVLNRRVTIEQRMFDAAAGKRAMPTPEELRQWAVDLGTPTAGVVPSDEWAEVERVRDLPEVDEALSNFYNDATSDNAAMIVRAVMRAAAGVTVLHTKASDEGGSDGI